MGLWVRGLGFGLFGVGFKASVLGLWIQDLGIRIESWSAVGQPFAGQCRCGYLRTRTAAERMPEVLRDLNPPAGP